MIEEVLETIYSCGKCKTKPIFLILPNGLQNQAYERGSHEGTHFRPRCEVRALVVRFSQIEGYRCLSLMRASGVVKCQFALVWLALRAWSQAAISSMRVCLSGIRRSRHWDDRTPSSDSARSSQLPCCSASSKRSTSRLASGAGKAS